MNRPNRSEGPALIWCPFPDEEAARPVIEAMLDQDLIACANLVPTMISYYKWKGVNHREGETGVLLKTDASLLSIAIERLAELHPYSQPAIVGWRCDAAAPATIAWLGGLVA